MEKFKQEFTLEQRMKQSRNLLQKYNDRIPVIIHPGNKITPSVDKYKYLVPNSLTVGEFVSIIRKRIKLGSEKAMFIFTGGVLPPTGSSLYNIYHEHCDEDGFLYLVYSLENTFGSDIPFELF
jgi:GABA(A) receptor-associated protein